MMVVHVQCPGEGSEGGNGRRTLNCYEQGNTTREEQVNLRNSKDEETKKK